MISRNQKNMNQQKLVGTNKIKNGRRYRHFWTEEEKIIVRRDYRNSRKSAREIAWRISRPGVAITEAAVMAMARDLGLAQKSDRCDRRWTDEEDEKLEYLLTKYNVRRVAKYLRRSVNAVLGRAFKLSIQIKSCRDWYTAGDVCAVLGVDQEWVRKRIDSGALKASWHHDSLPSQIGSKSWHITSDDLRNYIQCYTHELQGKNVDIVAVVDLVTHTVPTPTGYGWRIDIDEERNG